MTQRMSVLGATLTCEVKALMTITLVFISSQATHADTCQLTDKGIRMPFSSEILQSADLKGGCLYNGTGINADKLSCWSNDLKKTITCGNNHRNASWCPLELNITQSDKNQSESIWSANMEHIDYTTAMMKFEFSKAQTKINPLLCIINRTSIVVTPTTPMNIPKAAGNTTGNSSGTLAGPTTLPNCGGKTSSSNSRTAVTIKIMIIFFGSVGLMACL